MRKIKFGFLTVVLLSVTVAVSACRSTIRYTQVGHPQLKARHAGPPPHAPAHGYRHKHHDGVEMVYKSGIGAYVVIGYKDYYFHGDRYYRFRNGSWEFGFQINGKWQPTSDKKLPQGLKKKHVCKKKKKK